jgi:hypothetical protein
MAPDPPLPSKGVFVKICQRQAKMAVLAFSGKEAVWAKNTQLYGYIQPYASPGF